jgi:hypothetical protein
MFSALRTPADRERKMLPGSREYKRIRVRPMLLTLVPLPSSWTCRSVAAAARPRTITPLKLLAFRILALLPILHVFVAPVLNVDAMVGIRDSFMLRMT